MNKKLLLWDIDGTLMTSGWAGLQAFLLAIEIVFGVKTTMDGVDYRGRTDLLIMRSMFKKLGVADTDENLQKLKEVYFKCLAEELPKREGQVYPGVLEILQRCQKQDDVILALLTGNLSRGAELKLSHYKLWHYFEFGAFSDDSQNRNDLGPVALRRAQEKYQQEFFPHCVFIIGDTPHDIACGKMINAQTIAVATGGYSYEELLDHKPDALFNDLSDTKKFFELIV